MSTVISERRKKKFQFDIDADLDQQFRTWVYRKYQGYRKGCLTIELENMIRHGMECSTR